jgi:hypothetical protein
MSFKKDQIPGGWWRFDRYEIVGGYIRPAQGAKLEEYDVWENFNESIKTTRGQPPYQKLIEILAKAGVDRTVRQKGDSPLDVLPRDKEGTLCLPSAAESHLLKWCSEYGLLGILTNDVSSISLAPRWKPLGADDASPLMPTLIQYNRFPEEWTTSKVFNSPLPPPGQPQLVQRGALVSRTESKNFPTPHVISQDGDGHIGQRPLGLELAGFFPSVPEDELDTFEYPLPLSPEFWRLYCEPVHAFLDAAVRLRSCAQRLNPRNLVASISRDAAAIMLNRLLAQNTRVVQIRRTDNVLEQRWYCPSLLSLLAAMLVNDITEGRFTFRCPGCRSAFVSSGYQSRYCSSECRHREQKRDLRRRIRIAESLFASEKGVKEVALEMDERVASVRTWYRNFRRNQK